MNYHQQFQIIYFLLTCHRILKVVLSCRDSHSSPTSTVSPAWREKVAFPLPAPNSVPFDRLPSPEKTCNGWLNYVIDTLTLWIWKFSIFIQHHPRILMIHVLNNCNQSKALWRVPSLKLFLKATLEEGKKWHRWKRFCSSLWQPHQNGDGKKEQAARKKSPRILMNRPYK